MCMLFQTKLLAVLIFCFDIFVGLLFDNFCLLFVFKKQHNKSYFTSAIYQINLTWAGLIGLIETHSLFHSVTALYFELLPSINFSGGYFASFLQNVYIIFTSPNHSNTLGPWCSAMHHTFTTSVTFTHTRSSKTSLWRSSRHNQGRYIYLSIEIYSRQNDAIRR